MSKWDLAEEQQRWNFSKMESLQLPYFSPLMWEFLKHQSWFYCLIYLGGMARNIIGGDTLFLIDFL